MNYFPGDLASLLHPLFVDEFFRGYWGKKPLYIHRENRDYYKGLYSSADMDDYLRFSAPIKEWNETVKMGIKFRRVPTEVLFDQNQPGFDYCMIRKSQKAVSLIINFIQDHSNRVFYMAKIMEEELEGRIKGRVNVNAYYSPGNSYISPHLDAHDELNIQLEGTKRWRVYEPSTPNPYFGMPLDTGFDPKSKNHYLQGKKPFMEVILQPGDFLYMPRGFWHDPVNTDNEPSLGLTIGVHPICQLDTVLCFARAVSEKRQDLRQSIPVGLSVGSLAEQMIRKTIQDFSAEPFERVSLSELSVNLRRGIPDDGISLKDVYLPSPAAIENLGPVSVLSRPRESVWTFHQIYGLLKLNVGRRELGLRKELKGALEHIRDCAFFTPADLPGEMTQQEKTSFCRFLVNFGALSIDTTQGQPAPPPSDNSLLRSLPKDGQIPGK
ncbi:MAG: cupin-like domain-containing protein [Candidatus Riflebacteria bacterium]|nr:cupin-like domain-containing protein [Candidatus Riflebacteria bacterium]